MKKNQLNGKVVIITGAAGGIGGAMAELMDNYGAALSLADINIQGLNSLASRLSREPYICECDITDREAVARFIADTVEKFGRLDILINNAGIVVPGPFEDQRLEDVDKQVKVNLMGALYFTRESIAAIKKSGGGHIVTISSLAGIVPEPFSAMYAATKFALRGFSQSLGIELRKHNIYVSAVFPDTVNSPMMRHEARHGGSPLTFLGKPLNPRAVARAVLCSAIGKKKIEVYVPRSQGIIARLGTLFPGLLPRIWPRLERNGEKNKKKYLEYLESEGL